ncbi:MAG: hypothetical protein KKA32_07130 [Actinobacteria bacterium]|nr:hypothetical protein [Actinomycetota bacterium]
MNDAQTLESSDPLATAYYLTLIAQEEFAKGFLLALVVRNVIPWDRRLLRAARDHRCKQLLCVVMDYLQPDHEEFLDRCDAVVHRHELTEMPAKVADAMHILRYEKIGRWSDSHWVWGEDPEYDADALAVSDGQHERQKQDALYVRLAVDGGVASAPTDVSDERLEAERERAERFAGVAESVLAGDPNPGLDYDQVEEWFRVLFASTGSAADRA